MPMTAPTIVYDLDGTLADTAEDLVATLNYLLGREGLAPMRVESAGSLARRRRAGADQARLRRFRQDARPANS